MAPRNDASGARKELDSFGIEHNGSRTVVWCGANLLSILHMKSLGSPVIVLIRNPKDTIMQYGHLSIIPGQQIASNELKLKLRAREVAGDVLRKDSDLAPQ
ncbi:hypothetical protein AXG93_4085s1350 [Marchantia polymorpha subsp. ruderalis]|uniref:Sulfotransferase n=1 Tax=Marchantia polymorpha subsp. ruderalis TaxID=1480154 RepID=A0A176WK51_MARPO|nr:hypothetical protein AXG93_4085s1350 [Marchantia polymorpha subsp. ruderalis]